MKKNFTELVCIGIACFCMVSAMGQEKMTAGSIIEEKNLQKQNEIELRTDEVEYWWPDSVIIYTAEGYPDYKSFYDKVSLTATYMAANDNWELYGPENTNGWFFRNNASVNFYVRTYELVFVLAGINYELRWTYDSSDEYNTVYDNNGNLILVGISPSHYGNGYFNEYRINYNERNSPALIERYNYDYLTNTMKYEYNEKGHLTLFEYNTINIENQLPVIRDGNFKRVAKFDEKGRPAVIYSFQGNTSLSTWLLEYYQFFYYSDEENIPNVEVENNTPIGSDNKGSFDLDVNIPADSIGNGSITVTFPEGFTQDETNTSLTLDFAGDFELKITKQDNNSWLLEIRPKTLKSATLRAGEAKTMLHVAYKVDEKTKKGTYDISVNSILLETKGGNYIPEPAITVPAEVNRWGVGNEQTQTLYPIVYINAQTIFIQTESVERITVYSVTGSKLYEAPIQAGLTTINAAQFPHGLLFVRGSSGWVKKVLNK